MSDFLMNLTSWKMKNAMEKCCWYFLDWFYLPQNLWWTAHLFRLSCSVLSKMVLYSVPVESNSSKLLEVWEIVGTIQHCCGSWKNIPLTKVTTNCHWPLFPTDTIRLCRTRSLLGAQVAHNWIYSLQSIFSIFFSPLRNIFSVFRTIFG